MNTKNGSGDGITVQMSRDELLDFLWEYNPDKSKANMNYVCNMQNMIVRVTNRGLDFSAKQRQWILSKIRFIFKRNRTLKMYDKNIEGFEIV
jgi:hypothetical protein